MTSKKGNRFLENIIDPSQGWLPYFLLGVLGLGVLGEGVASLLLDDLAKWVSDLTKIPQLFIQIALLALIAAVILAGVYLSNWDEKVQTLLSAQVKSQTNIVPLQETYWGLIAIASLPREDTLTAAEEAFHFHWRAGRGKLRYCWLICTQKVTDVTLERFKKIVAASLNTPVPISVLETPSESLKPDWEAGPKVQVQIYQIDWNSSQDPNQIKQLIDRIYKQVDLLSHEPRQLIADYTGGTKSMTAGVVLACSSPERHLQYITGQYNSAGELDGSQVMEVKLSYRLKLARDR